MKRAVILHGTDGSPDESWFGWLKGKLEAQGYEVWLPYLEGNHAPDREKYNDFLLGSDWDFTDNIVVGHSSGAVSILNLLMDERCPKIKFGLLVSPWAHGTPIGMPDEQFIRLFPPEGFDFELIKSKTDGLAIIHADGDPYCPLEQAQYLSEKLAAPLTVIHAASHLGDGTPELPEIWESLQAKQLVS